jgi:6,7-dimethyl-8-ribityllumazine synthase
MAVKRIPMRTDGEGRRIGIVASRFNEDVAQRLLANAVRAIRDAGVKEEDITVATVPGALELPLALQRMAQTGEYDGLVALGAVIRGETFHFEIVATESAAGIASVGLEFGIPIGNGVLTCDTEAQAMTRVDEKGAAAALAALELANLLDDIDEE